MKETETFIQNGHQLISGCVEGLSLGCCCSCEESGIKCSQFVDVAMENRP